MYLRLGAIVFSALASVASAQGTAEPNYPSRPIRMIAPSSAGGPVDVIARVVSQGLGEVLGQQVVVDNRAGAAGMIGAELVANGSPDGYTLMFGFSGPLAIAPQLAAKRPYDATKDFAPISLVSQGQYVLLVRPSLPVSSIRELVAMARAQPGKLNYASGGNGTGIHLAGELLKLTAGVNIVHVPYKGAGPGMTALLANEVDLMFNGLPPALPHVKSGKLKGLAVAGAKRSPLLPEMPTVREGGVDFNTAGWYGILAPPKTSRAIVMRVHAATMKVLATPSVSENLTRQGVEVIGSTPEEFAKILREEWSKTEKVIKAAGLKGQG
ncbi:MAG TPA: tripartite tricarboxylate transporter substrate binding protein [Burkholderiales bacterium]|nr:tripartite tricarboxylate transporter substrate binding protein [Burkholderiales bacterium]